VFRVHISIQSYGNSSLHIPALDLYSYYPLIIATKFWVSIFKRCIFKSSESN